MISPALPITCESVTITTDAFRIDGTPPDRLELISGEEQPPTLAAVVYHEAIGYRARGTATGEFLARQMERLAQLIRWTGATTPQDHETRMEVWDEEIREQWFDRGYHDGYEAGRRDGARALRADGY
jgi:hypothetical protein